MSSRRPPPPIEFEGSVIMLDAPNKSRPDMAQVTLRVSLDTARALAEYLYFNDVKFTANVDGAR